VKIDAEARVVARISIYLINHLDDVLLSKLISVVLAAFKANAGANVEITSILNTTKIKRDGTFPGNLAMNISLTPGTGLPPSTAWSYNNALASPNVTKQADDMAAKLSQDISASSYQQNVNEIAAARSQIEAEQQRDSIAYNTSKADLDANTAIIAVQGDAARAILAAAKTVIETVQAVNVVIKAKIILDRAQIRADNFTLAILVQSSSDTLQSIKGQYNEAIKNGGAGNGTLTGNNSVSAILTSDYKTEALRLAALTQIFESNLPWADAQDTELSNDLAELQTLTANILAGIFAKVSDIRAKLSVAVEQENFRERIERSFKVLFDHVLAIALVEYSNDTSANYTLKIHVQYQQNASETNEQVKTNLAQTASSVVAQWLGTPEISVGSIADPSPSRKRFTLQQNNTYVVPVIVSDPNGASSAPSGTMSPAGTPQSSGTVSPPGTVTPPGTNPPPGSPNSPPAGVSTSGAHPIVFALSAFVVAFFTAQLNM